MPVKLDPQQQSVVDHGKGPLLVTAVAGAGKTTAIVHRIARLVKSGKADPHSILATTFTRRAAREMNVRLKELGVKKVRVGTFHSICYEILRKDGKKYGGRFRIKGELPLNADLLRDIGIPTDSEGKTIGTSTVKEFMSWCKNWLVSPEKAMGMPWAVRKWAKLNQMEDKVVVELAKVYARVEKWRKSRRFITFDDILYQTYKCLKHEEKVLKRWQERYKYVIVDEFQDSNKAQHEVMRMLAAPENNLLVVGDDDQSIYAWRAATPKFILEFEKEFGAKVTRMERNYRSLPGITKAANAIISNNKKRLPKSILPQRQGNCECVRFSEYSNPESEAMMIAQTIRTITSQKKYGFGDMAVLYRTNRQSDAIQSAMGYHQIPFMVIGGMMLYDYKVVKDILGYLQYGRSIARRKKVREDREAFYQIANVPKRGLGPGFLGKVADTAEKEGTTLVGALAYITGNRTQESGIETLDNVMGSVVRQIQKKVPPSEIISYLVDSLDYVNRVSTDENYSKFVREKMDRLVEASRAMDTTKEFLQYIERLYIEGGDEEEENEEHKVKLLTIHKAKGLEWPVVFSPGWNNGTLPHFMALNVGEIEEERRLAYVAITRARDLCFLSRSMEGTEESPFICEAQIR